MILEKKVVPFLGAGAGLCGRPAGIPESAARPTVPSAVDLTNLIAKECAYPDDQPKDLARVSQYAEVTLGDAHLYESLQQVFDRDFEPSILHRFLAKLPRLIRERAGTMHRHPARERLVVLTTNYDDLLEQAFVDAGEPFHKLVYLSGGNNRRGKFLHWPPGESPRLVENANEYRLEPVIADGELKGDDDRWFPAIVKVHGAVVRQQSATQSAVVPHDSSFVITEDHYIDYLTHTDISSLLPMPIVSTLANNHFLFMGYSLRDWNLRVILRRIWREQEHNYQHWSIQLGANVWDQKYWNSQGVEVINMEIACYLKLLNSQILSA